MVLFGVSNMLSDIYECAGELGKKITKIVTNVQEEKRERTKDLETRLQELDERPIIMSLEDFTSRDDEECFVVPTTPRKSELIEYLKNMYGLQFTQLIHPTAHVSRYAAIGEGVFVGAASIISPGVVVMDHVFIHNGVTVGHDTVLHEYVRLNPGSNVAGHVEIYDNAMIGLGANVIEELVIGKGAIVAAGAVVTKDVDEKTMIAGVPAVLKKVYQ